MKKSISVITCIAAVFFSVNAFCQPPTEPRGLAATAISYRKISLRWTDKSFNETGFKIERKLRGCNSSYAWTEIATVSKNIYDDFSIDPDTQYSYRVRAYNDNGDSEYSNCGTTATSSYQTPSCPVNLMAKHISSSRIDLSWSTWSTDITKFEIYRKADSGSWSLLSTTGPTAFSYTDTTATGNQSSTSYCYYLLAYNSLGSSPPSHTACVPFNPTNLSATAGSTGRVTLSWTDNSDKERGFEIWRQSGGCSGDEWELVKLGGINRTNITDAKLQSGTNYSYKVRAYSRSWGLPYVYGYSAWSNCVEYTEHQCTAPETPPSVNASDGVYADKIRITWTASSGAKSYKVYRATSSGGTKTLIGSPFSTSYDDTSATCDGNYYYYWVKAVNSCGESSFSSSNTGYCEECLLPLAPTMIFVNKGMYAPWIEVFWYTSLFDNATSYKVYRSTNFGIKYLIGSSPGTYYTDVHVTCDGRYYYYWVKAVNSCGESSFNSGNLSDFGDHGYCFWPYP